MAEGNSGRRSVADILGDAERMLVIAKQGLADLQGAVPGRRLAGLMNLIVYGRSVTFALQNLKGVIGDDFSKWYDPWQQQMIEDKDMKDFKEARNTILHTAQVPVTQVSFLQSFRDQEDLQRLGERPVNASGFFFADEFGGSGWIVRSETGEDEKLYVDVPEDIFRSHFVFNEAEPGGLPTINGKQVDALCSQYIGKLSKIVDDAKVHFLR